ncbi:hypothetical protein HD806DRAFT_506576 [Xylariaceae sp. AK1471]|nr:hypothetical protein HD806DRAFT_506576 [Xylariaceae sp. AK1471]
MAVSFGFSVGDVVAVGNLVYNIIKAINERKGAATDYQSFVSTLRSLHSCTNAIKDSLKFSQATSISELHEVALINGLMYEIHACRDLLNAFLDNTYKYTANLLPLSEARELKEAQTVISLFRGRKASMKKLEKAWKKVSWAVFRNEDVQKLERDLQGHMLALQIYELFLQRSSLSRVEKTTIEIALTTRNIEVTMKTMFDLLTSVHNTLPPQISDKINKRQPVFFEDALGRSIELPREFCVSKERFHRHLELLFQDMPGHNKVFKKQYTLEDAEGTAIISADNWHLKVTAGTRVAMTILHFQLVSGAKDSVAQKCPRCKTVNNKSDLQRSMIKCFNCTLIFEIVDNTKQSAELRDSTWHEVSRRISASSDLQPLQQDKKKSMNQDVFHRIRYFQVRWGPIGRESYRFRCNYHYEHDCPNWIWMVRGTACATCEPA